MSYLLKSKAPSRTFRSLVWKVAGVVVLLFLVAFLLRPSVFYFYGAFSPIRRFTDTLSSYSSNIFSSKYALLTKINQLQNENDALQAQINQYQAATDLINAYSALASSSVPLTPAAVISRPPFIPYDTLLIDKGESDGLSVGAIVYSDSNLLPIGTVSDAVSHAAHVRLFSYPGDQNEIEIGTSTAEFEATGNGNGVFEADIPKVFPATVGEGIRMPARSIGIYASIDYITSGTADPFNIIYFHLPVRFDSLEFVGIKTVSS